MLRRRYDPERWTPEFREAIEAIRSGLPRDMCDVLLVRAGEAATIARAEALRASTRREWGALDVALQELDLLALAEILQGE